MAHDGTIPWWAQQNTQIAKYQRVSQKFPSQNSGPMHVYSYKRPGHHLGPFGYPKLSTSRWLPYKVVRIGNFFAGVWSAKIKFLWVKSTSFHYLWFCNQYIDSKSCCLILRSGGGCWFRLATTSIQLPGDPELLVSCCRICRSPSMTNRMLLDRLCMSLILSNMFSQFRWAVHIFHIEYTTLNQATCFFVTPNAKSSLQPVLLAGTGHLFLRRFGLPCLWFKMGQNMLHVNLC